LRAKNTHDIFVSNPKRHFEDILKQKGFILKRVVEKVNKKDHVNLKEMRAAVKDEKMSKYISVVEGTCDDKAFVKAVEERFELTGVETTEDKLTFKDILYDNNRLKEHFGVSKALSTAEHLEKLLTLSKENDFAVKSVESDLAKIQLVRWMEVKLDIPPLFLTKAMCAAIRDSPLDIRDAEYELVKKTFRIRTKAAKPRTKGEFLGLYAKGVGHISLDVLSQDIKQNRSRMEDRGKRDYAYETDDAVLSTHLNLYMRRNKVLHGIDERTVQRVMGCSTAELTIRAMPTFERDSDEEELFEEE